MACEPLLLAFDTSAAHCAAALLCGGEIVGERFEEMGRGQAERLMPLLEELLAGAGREWRDLTAIGVGVGPGNFTGIRISVAAARGLALGLGVPAIGVSRLEAQVFGQPRPVTAQLDARRGMLYAQRFSQHGAEAPALVAAAEAEAEAEALGPDASERLARTIARIAATRLNEAHSLPRPAPLYIRRPDAAPPRDPAPVIIDG